MKKTIAALLFVASTGALASSPLPDTKWEVKVDPEGWPVMMNSSREYGVIFSLGYNKSKHCGDLKMLIGNIVPIEPIPEGLPDPLMLPSEMNLPRVGDISLGNGEVSLLQDPTAPNMVMLYTYTPADKLIMELMNSEVFFWWDGVFKEGDRAIFNNTGFVENLNEVTGLCFDKTKGMAKEGDVNA